uniref:Uncharacterized protein n=1 Tax=Anguilla anguilla TaxID=7936 RepID=A0A0E9SPE8_ANGAN
MFCFNQLFCRESVVEFTAVRRSPVFCKAPLVFGEIELAFGPLAAIATAPPSCSS